LLGLLLLLIGVAVIGLRPWAPASVVPSVAIAPELDAGLAESVAVRPEQATSVADASVVADNGSGIAAAKRVSHAGQTVPDSPKVVAVAVVAPAQPVARSGGDSGPIPPGPEVPASTPDPAAAPTPSPAPAPPAAPVVAGIPEGGSRGPITSGSGGGPPVWGCTGDEYILVISPVEEEAAESPSRFDIRIEYFSTDGNYGEFSLQGDEEEVRELVSLLSAQDDCVRVVEEPAAEDTVEDEPEATPAPAELGEAQEPDLP
jgi:hypothetical protein